LLIEDFFKKYSPTSEFPDFVLASKIYLGEEADRDLPTVVTLLEKAAKAGDSLSKYILCRILSEDNGPLYDPDKALDYFNQALTDDVSEAQFDFGVLLIIGIYEFRVHAIKAVDDLFGGMQDALRYNFAEGDEQLFEDPDFLKLVPRTVSIGSSLVDTNLPLDPLNLTTAFFLHLLLERDFDRASTYFNLAASQDNPEALFMLGVINFVYHLYDDDKTEALYYFDLAASRGHRAAQYDLGYYYMKGKIVPKDLKKALELILPLADLGYATPQTTVAKIYAKSDGPCYDMVKSVDYLNRAIAQGEPNAMYEMALLHLVGYAVQLDSKRAGELISESAKRDCPEAQCILGKMYNQGDIMPHDPTIAATWYRKAAEQDNAPAQFYLGKLLYDGDGVPQNIFEAIDWIKKSAAQGFPDAIAKLKQLELN
jgi:TPR repeat protein